MAVTDSLEVLREAERTVREQGRAVLCQVVRAEGSTPGKVGWKLLVRGDGSQYGNLGGGAFEAMVIADAAERLGEGAGGSEVDHGTEPEARAHVGRGGRDRPAASVKRYYLTEHAVRGEPTGMVCGGMMEVLLETLAAPPLVVVCGGGPVGQAVASAAVLAGFGCLVAEDRAAYREPGLFPAAASTVAVSRDYAEDFLAGCRGRDLYVAIVSRCWETDAAALASVLRQRPPRLAYLGLMGSRRKVARVRREVAGRGLALDGIELRAPIGLPIGGDTPGEIAVSIVAEMIQTRSRAAAPAAAAPAERAAQPVG